MASHSVQTATLETDFTYEFNGTDFTYEFNGVQPKDLIYQGDAHMQPTYTRSLRLTKTDSSGNPMQNSYGRAIYRHPVQLWIGSEKAHFKTTVKFTLNRNSDNNFPGDGLAFFVVPVGHRFPNNICDGNLGIYGGANCDKVFAVEFDIFVNEEWDPSFPHFGINIETRASQTVAQIPDSFIGKEVTLEIAYVPGTQVISAVVIAGPEKFEICHVRDLSGVLPQEVHVGLAGATGDFVANHDVSYWEFHSGFDKNGA